MKALLDEDIRTGQVWRLHTQYQNGKIRFALKAMAGRGADFGIWDDMWLTDEQWDWLVKWVAFQRADDERRRQREATP